MTKEELNNWLFQNPSVDQDFSYDDRGNYKGETYHKISDQYYAVGWCNGHPEEKWGERGYIRGVYEPRKVQKVVELIEATSYIEE